MLRPSKDPQDLAIVARDDSTPDAVGDVKDLFFDDEGRALRDLVVRTGHGWKGHEVLLAPQWNRRVSWAERSVAVDPMREALQKAPCHDPASPLSRELEAAVFGHHGRAACWPGAMFAEASASGQAVSRRVVQ